MVDIELVIKIPEEVYKASQIVDVKYEDVVQIPLESIAKGTPLPKGHGDLIDKSKLKVHYVGTDIGTDCPVYLLPTVDEAQPIIKADNPESEKK